MRNLILVILFFASAFQGFSQTPAELAVPLTAAIQENPNTITLQWPSASANLIKIYRKADKDNSSFLEPIANLSGSATTYTDTSIEIGKEYEYRVELEYASYSANGYMLSGIKVLQKENKGQLILLVEASKAGSLQQELKTLEDDITGDGWTVVRHDVQVNETPPVIRNRIIQDYNVAPTQVKAVFIVGHIAVPYSGLIFPDGHPEHRGAWPADAYYGDINGNWTDSSVNNTSAVSPRHHNVPGDGKFDQSELPSDLELQVGRIDFFDLPIFSESETELLRKYLNKNHAFRNKFFVPTPRGLIDDNFGGGGSSFSSSAYRSFYTMFGPENVDDRDYFTTMANESYLWSHGNGPGWYTSARDVGESADFANTGIKSVFTTLFGSYFGDWDSRDNFMRSALASGDILTCAWSGLPQWQFHQMALGDHIGYCAKNANNAFDYQYTARNTKMVHVALLGDPTLRMHIVAPPSNLQIIENNGVGLSWNASSESVLGYHVYSRMNDLGDFERITQNIITGTSYTSANTTMGLHNYMVRAVKLEETRSGSYYNLSQGIFNDIQITETGITLVADAGEDKIVSCLDPWADLGGTTTTIGATYLWTTVDGTFETATDQSTVRASGAGTYVLTVSNPNSETVTDEVVVTENLSSPQIELGDTLIIQSGEQVVIGIEALADHTYAWASNEALSDTTIANPTASPLDTATFILTVTAPNGCTAQDSITVQVETMELESGKITIYPNPTNDVIHIVSDTVVSDIEIYDFSGKMLLTPSSPDVDVSMLPPGLYIARFATNNTLFERTFIKLD